MAISTTDKLIADLGTGPAQAVYLVSGDMVVAEAQARKLAQALADKAGCALTVHRHPAEMGSILADLRTFSLFESAKVVLVVDSALMTDRAAAAELIDQAAAGLPLDDVENLKAKQRLAASRLMQALHVFAIDANGPPERAVGELPDWALKGGKKLRKNKSRGRSAKDVKQLTTDLVRLLEAAQGAGLQGFAEGDMAQLGDALENGLPPGHSLVLAEHSVAADHPLVTTLDQRQCHIDVGHVEAGKGGDWQGLGPLLAELVAETGCKMDSAAAQELARRTLRQTGGWKDRRVDGETTTRFAGEYRKLAGLSQGRPITRQLVEDVVEDRGEEDVWKILDAVGNGRAQEALQRFRRMMSSAEDVIATRLSFFALFAGFCRQLTAVAGMARQAKVPAGVRNYNQFKSRWAAALQGAPAAGGKNPLTGLHPYRLHRAYLAASRLDRDLLQQLPWRILQTEFQVKGDSTDPDAAIAQLLVLVSKPGGS